MSHHRATTVVAFFMGALCALAILTTGASAAAFIQIDEFACEVGNACGGATTFEPQSVAVDESSGDVYVADGEHNVVDRFDPDGSYDSQIANGSFDFSGTFGPGVAVDGSGNLYIGAKGGNAYAYDPAGSLLWEKPGVGATRIWDVAFDPSGGLWILDRPGSNLVELDPATGVQTGQAITLEGTEAFKFAFRATGAIVATDTVAPLGEYEADGTFLRDLQTEPGAWTADVAVDPLTDSLFATAHEPPSFDPVLRRWDSSDNPGTGVALPGQGVEGVAVDGSRHRIYLIDKETDKVLVFAPPAPLTVDVTGMGAVQSDPAGISCQAEESCTAELAGSVTLTADPAPGHVFAGWLGCRKTGADTCTVSLDSATEVTAIFLKEASAGATGPIGPQGATGSGGARGGEGPVGPHGPQGRRGPVGKVTCKITGARKPKVTCTVTPVATASVARLYWRLMRGGRAVAHGIVRSGHVRLGSLSPGRYRLKVEGQKGGTAIVVG